MPSPGGCPCGSDAPYAACCEPLHDGTREAVTAQELMRSRYSAYARGRSDHVFRTWHPRTRPADVSAGDEITWVGLDIHDVVAGGPGDEDGEVEFTARFVDAAGGAAAMHERSRFVRRGGRWRYVDGDVD